MWKSLVLLFVSFSAGTTVPYCPPPPPLAPVNWEADVDPRFDPPVEQVVIDMTHYVKTAPANPWESWNLAALDRLRFLSDEPHWKSFSQTALRLFYACPLDGAREIKAAELRHRADAVVDDPDNVIGVFLSHMNYAANDSADLIRPLLAHPNYKIRVAVAGRLIGRTRALPEEVVPVIEQLATSDLPEERQAAAFLLAQAPSKDNRTRALAIAATVSDDAVKRVQERLAYMRADVERREAAERSKEPMRLILEKEHK